MAKELEPTAALESQALLFLQNSPDYAIVVDADWSLVYANPVFRQKFFRTEATEGANFLSFLDAPSGARARELQPQLWRGCRHVELNHVAADAKIAPFHYSFFPLSALANDKMLLAGIGRERAADLGLMLEIIHLNLELEKKQKELSEANARLEQLAVTDQITRLYNRHYFFQVAQHFWEESRRYNLPLVALMMDLDNFKSVNDSYGHLFGDHVLKQTAVRMRNNTRKSDLLARYGGEEVVLLAPNTDLPTGLVLAERLRVAVATEPFAMGNCATTVTISVGVSGTELGKFDSFEALLESSDRALYGAKHAGRNCVYTYSDSMVSNW